MHVEPTVEAALQECHVQELLEPSPHLNVAMEVGITHKKIYNLRQLNRCAGTRAGKCPGGYSKGAPSKGARGATSKGARGAAADQSQT